MRVCVCLPRGPQLPWLPFWGLGKRAARYATADGGKRAVRYATADAQKEKLVLDLSTKRKNGFRLVLNCKYLAMKLLPKIRTFENFA